MVKILDFDGRKEELLRSHNPFALVVLAQLTAIKTSPGEKSRLVNKLELIEYLYQHGWGAVKIENMYLFLDNLLNLKPALEIQYLDEMKRIEEIHGMRLISTAERYGFQEGMQQGRQQGMQQGLQQGLQEGEQRLLEKQLKVKFEDLPIRYIEKIRQAEPTELDQWGVNLMNASTLEDVFKQKK